MIIWLDIAYNFVQLCNKVQFLEGLLYLQNTGEGKATKQRECHKSFYKLQESLKRDTAMNLSS